MEPDTRERFRQIQKDLDQYRQDSRHLLVLTESVKSLAKKVDRYSMAITGLASTFVADLVIHLYIK